MTTVPPQTTRAAVYGRISDDREGRALNVNDQIARGRRYCEHRDWKIVLVRSDNDISATKGDPRPGFQDIMAAVDAGEIDVIVVVHQSRLWRNRVERATGIGKLADARVSIAATDGPDLDLSTATGRGLAGIIGEYDTMESEIKSERVRWKVQQLAAAGKIANGGARPFGYIRVYQGEGPRRSILREEINEPEAAIIRECADRVLAGHSLRSIVVDLNQRGIRTSLGNRWTMQALRALLRSGRIAGLREHRRQIVLDDNGNPVKAVWPAIITVEQHQQLRALLDAHERPTGARVRTHYLTGFLYCSACADEGVKMAAGRVRGRMVYRCPPDDGCNGRVILMEPLRAMVDEYMVRKLSDPATLAELAAREAEEDTESAALITEIEADERRLTMLQRELSDGDEDGLPEAMAAVRRVRQRLGENRGRLAALTRTPLAKQDFPDLARRWDGLHLDLKQDLLRLFVDKILIGPAVRGRAFFDPDRVDIIPKGGRRA